MKVTKIIRIVLLVIACITFFVGLSFSKIASDKAAHDLSKIKVSITQKSTSSSEVYLTYEIKNNTKVNWSYLEIKTYVYDKSGNSLGAITATLGTNYSNSDLKLEKGKKISKKVTLKYDNSDFMQTLYDANLSDLVFESEVTYGSYYNSNGSFSDFSFY